LSAKPAVSNRSKATHYSITSSTRSKNTLPRSRQADRLAKARLIETILELLHQDLETQFAGAVARCDPLDLEPVVERRRQAEVSSAGLCFIC
jgi:hypothetical protein